MRPRELVLRGFRSYADETTFDFGNRSLIGIVGPIGSGKSSILDAISFALYGKTPRVDRETKSLINQRRDTLAVSLTFDVDGATWKIVRSLRRNGASAHALYRRDGEEFAEITDKAREVTERVEALLGMDFEAFRRSVLLAQNQFAGFLEATATDRNKVLKGVFGFERLDTMRGAVKERLDRLGGRLAALAERRSSADVDRAALATKQAELAGAEARASTLAALRLSVSQADDLIREADAGVASALKDALALDAVADQVPTREATVGLFEEAAASASSLAEAESAALAANAAADAAAAELEAALAAVGGREALERAADVVAALGSAQTDRDRESGRLEAAGTLHAGAITARAAAGAAMEDASLRATEVRRILDEAVAEEETGRGALHEAQHRERALLLRAGLAVGEACPVCTQTVTTIPALETAPGLQVAEERLAAAIAATAAARQADGAAQAALAETRAGHAGALRRVEEAADALASVEAALAAADAVLQEMARQAIDMLGEGDPTARLGATRAAVAGAEALEKAARVALSAARQEVDAARVRRDAAASGLTRLRSDLANLAGKLGADIAVGESAETIEAALRALRDEWVGRRALADEARERASNEAEAARAARTEILEGAGLAASDDIVEVATEAAKEATRIGAEVGLLERRLAELDVLAGEEQQLLASSGLLERLHADLRPSGFLEFVLDERRRSLADLGGVHFETLSAGRYRFSEDADFNVVDLNAADLVRAPSSLSGGETFLASLALALALAEIVAREGGRLDAFFLDEGFGSLDPEHLDLAMDGIERLVAGTVGRVVVVVSHVPAMRDRVEDLIVLDRDDLGSTRVIRGAVAS